MPSLLFRGKKTRVESTFYGTRRNYVNHELKKK
jgi:hypothetical protein